MQVSFFATPAPVVPGAPISDPSATSTEDAEQSFASLLDSNTQGGRGKGLAETKGSPSPAPKAGKEGGRALPLAMFCEPALQSLPEASALSPLFGMADAPDQPAPADPSPVAGAEAAPGDPPPVEKPVLVGRPVSVPAIAVLQQVRPALEHPDRFNPRPLSPEQPNEVAPAHEANGPRPPDDPLEVHSDDGNAGPVGVPATGCAAPTRIAEVPLESQPASPRGESFGTPPALSQVIPGMPVTALPIAAVANQVVPTELSAGEASSPAVAAAPVSRPGTTPMVATPQEAPTVWPRNEWPATASVSAQARPGARQAALPIAAVANEVVPTGLSAGEASSPVAAAAPVSRPGTTPAVEVLQAVRPALERPERFDPRPLTTEAPRPAVAETVSEAPVLPPTEAIPDASAEVASGKHGTVARADSGRVATERMASVPAPGAADAEPALDAPVGKRAEAAGSKHGEARAEGAPRTWQQSGLVGSDAHAADTRTAETGTDARREPLPEVMPAEERALPGTQSAGGPLGGSSPARSAGARDPEPIPTVYRDGGTPFGVPPEPSLGGGEAESGEEPVSPVRAIPRWASAQSRPQTVAPGAVVEVAREVVDKAVAQLQALASEGRGVASAPDPKASPSAPTLLQVLSEVGAENVARKTVAESRPRRAGSAAINEPLSTTGRAVLDRDAASSGETAPDRTTPGADTDAEPARLLPERSFHVAREILAGSRNTAVRGGRNELRQGAEQNFL